MEKSHLEIEARSGCDLASLDKDVLMTKGFMEAQI